MPVPHIFYPGDVVKLVYTRALGARAARREGSSPFIPTSIPYARNFLTSVI